MQLNYPGQTPWQCHNVSGVGAARTLIEMVLQNAETPSRVPRTHFCQGEPDFPSTTQ